MTGSSSSSTSDSAGGGEYEGDYVGTVDATCGGNVLAGDLVFNVDADGNLDGTVTSDLLPGNMGTVSGTVDDMGAVDGNASVIVDNCTFEGSIDDMGNASGTLSCPIAMCVGTWEATLQ